MSAIDRIKQKYIEQNPSRRHQQIIPPDWVLAVAAVMDDQVKVMASMISKSRKSEA